MCDPFSVLANLDDGTRSEPEAPSTFSHFTKSSDEEEEVIEVDDAYVTIYPNSDTLDHTNVGETAMQEVSCEVVATKAVANEPVASGAVVAPRVVEEIDVECDETSHDDMPVPPSVCATVFEDFKNLIDKDSDKAHDLLCKMINLMKAKDQAMYAAILPGASTISSGTSISSGISISSGASIPLEFPFPSAGAFIPSSAGASIPSSAGASIPLAFPFLSAGASIPSSVGAFIPSSIPSSGGASIPSSTGASIPSSGGASSPPYASDTSSDSTLRKSKRKRKHVDTKPSGVFEIKKQRKAQGHEHGTDFLVFDGHSLRWIYEDVLTASDRGLDALEKLIK